MSWAEDEGYDGYDYSDFYKEKNMSTIRGRAYWASIQHPNVQYDPTWTIDVELMDKESIQAARDGGLTVKKGKPGKNGKENPLEGKPFVKITRGVERSDGTRNTPPIVVDGNKEPMLDLVGNGSEVIVQYRTYDWSNRFGSGVGSDLVAVQVLELVPYEGGVTDEFEVQGTTTVVTEGTDDFDDDIPF